MCVPVCVCGRGKKQWNTHTQLDAEHNCLQLTDAVVLLLTTLPCTVLCQLGKVKRAHTGHTGQRAKVSNSNRATEAAEQQRQQCG